MKNNLKIRTIRKEDLEIIFKWNNPESRGVFQEFTFESFIALEEDYKRNGCISEKFKMLIFEENEKPLGLIYINTLREGIVRIGMAICEEKSRNQGLGTKISRMVVGHLFQNYPIVRIEADTDVDNLAAQKVLEKCGFQKEGILRKYRFHHGKWRNSAIYSIIKDV